jgi:NADH-quinone oxidoreductase subunit A
LGVIIYNVITLLFNRELLLRVGAFKLARRDFYECGFRPQLQQPVRLPLQFLLICIFFLLYDIELLFLFPFMSQALSAGALDLGLILLYMALLVLSLYIDYRRHALF